MQSSQFCCSEGIHAVQVVSQCSRQSCVMLSDLGLRVNMPLPRPPPPPPPPPPILLSHFLVDSKDVQTDCLHISEALDSSDKQTDCSVPYMWMTMICKQTAWLPYMRMTMICKQTACMFYRLMIVLTCGQTACCLKLY